MKKKLFRLILIVVLIFILYMIINFFVTERNVKYKIDGYVVNENLEVRKTGEYYDFIVTDKNKDKYIFGIDGEFNKKKRLIKEIKYFKEGSLKCIYPIYKKNITGDIACRYDNKQVSYSYLKQIENTDVETIVSKLEKEGFNNSKWNDKSNKKEVLKYDSRKIDVYQDNLQDNYTFLMWGYRGLYILNKEKNFVADYLENDMYDNIHSALVGKYYITADSTKGKLKELICYDVENFTKKKIKLKKETSIKYYFNGVIEEKLYITDVGLSKQYVVDPKKGKIEELVATRDKFIRFKDLKKIEVEADELLEDEVYFTNSITNKKLNKLYPHIEDIKEVGQYYYFRTSVGDLYRVNKNSLDNAELLFTFNDISEWIIKDKDILVIVYDKVYFYNDEVGLVLIAKNSELKYNYKNICDFWKA